jgi:hypothetical protein
MPNAHSYLDKGFPGFSLGFRVEASLLLQAKKISLIHFIML